MSDIYFKAHQEYVRERELYLDKKLHPNRIKKLRAGKRYFKDDTFDIPENESEDKSTLFNERNIKGLK